MLKNILQSINLSKKDMEIEAVGLVYMLLQRNISDYILQKLGDVTLDFKFKRKGKRKKLKFCF